MRSEAEKSGLGGRAALIAEFPELGGAVVGLDKEVYAHFGLLFSAFALVEHSMINIVCFYQSWIEWCGNPQRTSDEWSAAIDRNHINASKYTFGNLAKRVKDIDEFDEISDRIADIKRIRDYTAHHFFREEAAYFGSVEGRWFLLIGLNDLRRKVKAIEVELDRRFQLMCERIGLPRPPQGYLEELTEREYAAACDRIASGGAKGGWEP